MKIIPTVGYPKIGKTLGNERNFDGFFPVATGDTSNFQSKTSTKIHKTKKLGTNVSHRKALLKMIFLFPR